MSIWTDYVRRKAGRWQQTWAEAALELREKLAMRQPFRCPVCNGVGYLSAGYYSRAGDVPERCRACEGVGVIWSA